MAAQDQTIATKKKVRFRVEYHGGQYHGFQLQDNAQTVQGELERVFKELTLQDCRVHCAGRTDSGVHALGQVAHLEVETRLSVRDLERGCNALLPDDIAVNEMSEADPDFHSRFSAIARWYRYLVWNGKHKRALFNDRSWHVKGRLDVEAMNQAASCLIGERDFSSFRSVHCGAEHAVRNVIFARVLKADPDWVVFHIVANAFVQNMVRIIAGTLVDVGRGKLGVDEFVQIFEAKDRTRAGMTAPAKALTLMNVYYNENEMIHDEQVRWNSAVIAE